MSEFSEELSWDVFYKGRSTLSELYPNVADEIGEVSRCSQEILVEDTIVEGSERAESAESTFLHLFLVARVTQSTYDFFAHLQAMRLALAPLHAQHLHVN